jgi:hypothetical protein
MLVQDDCVCNISCWWGRGPTAQTDKLIQRDLKSIALLHSFGKHAIFDGKRGTLLSDAEILDDQGKHFAFPAAHDERFILLLAIHRGLPLL